MADSCLKEDKTQTHLTRSMTRYTSLILVAALIAAGLFLLLNHAKASAAVQTVVTVEFDDGNTDQYQALAILNAHAMHATFYVNTGFIGDSTHLSWSQLQDLFAAGNEIAGHTLTHANLKHLKYADVHYQVCPGSRQPARAQFPADIVRLPFRVVRCRHGTGRRGLRLQQWTWCLWRERYQGFCRDNPARRPVCYTDSAQSQAGNDRCHH
jgi:peptidoglycan/xylan/chitin deacetylase (PgdA/CDA1 family)